MFSVCARASCSHARVRVSGGAGHAECEQRSSAKRACRATCRKLPRHWLPRNSGAVGIRRFVWSYRALVLSARRGACRRGWRVIVLRGEGVGAWRGASGATVLRELVLVSCRCHKLPRHWLRQGACTLRLGTGVRGTDRLLGFGVCASALCARTVDARVVHASVRACWEVGVRGLAGCELRSSAEGA
jgi:hypothetical protein